MMAYYEGHSAHPPANLLPAIAKALGVSVDAFIERGQLKRRAQGKAL